MGLLLVLWNNPELQLQSYFLSMFSSSLSVRNQGLAAAGCAQWVLFPVSRDVNKDLAPKDQDKDKDLTPKDQDKDKAGPDPQGPRQGQGPPGPDPQGQGQGLEICP